MGDEEFTSKLLKKIPYLDKRKRTRFNELVNLNFEPLIKGQRTTPLKSFTMNTVGHEQCVDFFLSILSNQCSQIENFPQVTFMNSLGLHHY